MAEQTVYQRQAPFIENRIEKLLASVFGTGKGPIGGQPRIQPLPGPPFAYDDFPGTIRTADFRDSNNDGIDDRDQNLMEARVGPALPPQAPFEGKPVQPGFPSRPEGVGLAEIPTEIPAYEVAGLSPQQLAAIQMGQTGLGAYQPFLSSAQQAIGTGIGTIGAGVGMIGPAASMTQRFGEAQVSPELAQARALASGATQAYDPTSAQAFMDPYQQQVTQQALEDIRRQADIAAQSQAAQAIQAGAFGGGREGVVRAETERGVQDIMSKRIFEDLSRNYMQAQQAAMGAQEAQQRRALQAASQLGQLGVSEAQLAEQGLGRGLSAASQLGQLGLSEAELAERGLSRGLGAAGQLGGFGISEAELAERGLSRGLGAAGQLGQLGQALGGLGAQTLQAGQAQAGLGELTQQLGQADISQMLGLGSLTQQFGYGQGRRFVPGQAQLEAARATELARQKEPFERLAFASDILRGVPSSQITYTQQPSPSMLQQALGLGIAGLGAYGSLGGTIGSLGF